MANIKITQADRYNALIALVEEYGITISKGEGEEMVTEGKDEVKAWIESRIEKLGTKAVKTSSKKSADYTELEENILSIMDTEGKSCSDITKAYNDNFNADLSTQKVQSRLTAMYKDGRVKRIEDKKKVLFAVA